MYDMGRWQFLIDFTVGGRELEATVDVRHDDDGAESIKVITIGSSFGHYYYSPAIYTMYKLNNDDKDKMALYLYDYDTENEIDFVAQEEGVVTDTVLLLDDYPNLELVSDDSDDKSLSIDVLLSTSVPKDAAAEFYYTSMLFFTDYFNLKNEGSSDDYSSFVFNAIIDESHVASMVVGLKLGALGSTKPVAFSEAYRDTFYAVYDEFCMDYFDHSNFAYDLIN